VTAEIDASGLLTADERRGTDVLNGIAYDPATKTFLLTGKYWPAMFQARFVPR
jgi:glutaminyl-peptide cyclotransferase